MHPLNSFSVIQEVISLRILTKRFILSGSQFISGFSIIAFIIQRICSSPKATGLNLEFLYFKIVVNDKHTSTF